MSHDLEIAANGEASMMFVGKEPWHGLGTRLNAPPTIQEGSLANVFVQVATGDFLACQSPVWNGTTIDRLFDAIWTEQFDIAIQDRIRRKTCETVDAIIKERLATILKSI